MSLKEKLTNFFGLTDEEDYYEETFATEEPARTASKQAVNQGGALQPPEQPRIRMHLAKRQHVQQVNHKIKPINTDSNHKQLSINKPQLRLNG